MSIATAATLMGRRQAEALMVTPCVIRRATGEVTTTADDSFTEVPVMATVYAGVCKLKFPNVSSPSLGDVPGLVVTKDRATLSLPVEGSGGVTVGDVVMLGASPLDAATDGVRVRVASVHHQSFATARRFTVEEVN